MNIVLYIIGGLLLLYLSICFFVWIQKKKRKSSPSAVISACYDGVSFLKIGDSRLKIIAQMERLGLLNSMGTANNCRMHKKNLDNGQHDYVLSQCGYLEFKEYNCIFYNDSLCGIQMKFKDTEDIGDVIEEAKKHISILNGKYEQTDDGRFIWTQKKPYRLVVLNTSNKTLAVYDYNGMHPNS